jgi:hypothetical protein
MHGTNPFGGFILPMLETKARLWNGSLRLWEPGAN